jgi:UPF0716 protein FxsA
MSFYLHTNNSAKYLIWTLILTEIILFIIVGSLIGILPTILLVILTTTSGFILLRRQNVEILKQMQMGIQLGQPQHLNILNNSLTMIAGFLLIIPGFMTDMLGVLCLIPGVRSKVFSFLIKKGGFKTKPQKPAANDSTIIDGECWPNDESSKLS